MGRVLLLVFFIFSYSLNANSQEQDTANIKEGIAVVPIPVVGYHSDLGAQFGAVAFLYNYRDGDIYPNYYHKWYFELSGYTKFSGQLIASYDSKYLIRGVRVTSYLGYFINKAKPFYGFNGAKSVYNNSWKNTESIDYRSRLFYTYQSDNFRFLTDLSGNINKHLFWIAGIALWNYKINSIDTDFLNKGKTDDLLPGIDAQPNLYDRYVAWGVIPVNEKNGGLVSYIKTGLIFDTRDYEANPARGIWAEMVLNSAPAIIGNKFSHARFTAIYRQYFTLYPKKLIFAYRFGYQGTLLGKAPFFIQERLNSSYTFNLVNGLGGPKSLRGILYSRLLFDDFAFGNYELRWRFAEFKAFKQNIFLATNLFVDMGRSLDLIDIDYDKIDANAQTYQLSHPEYDYSFDEYFTRQSPRMHYTGGAGLKIGINEGTIISVDYGRAFAEQDGLSGVYIDLDYMF